MNKMKRFSCFLLSTMITLYLVPNFSVSAAAANGVPEIFPKPQYIHTLGDSFKISSKVNIIGDTTDTSQAVASLKSVLAANGIAINSRSTADGTTIYIGTPSTNVVVKNALADLGLQAVDTGKKEGYSLGAKRISSTKSTIVLAGADNTGTSYAVQSFKQLLHKEAGSLTFPQIEVRDYPDMPLRGIIEGFYGAPWSHQDRLDLINFCGEHKMNTFIYAPKDDPYHREKWKEQYPTAELARMKELVDRSIKNCVNFVYAISPGLSINLTNETQFNADFALLVKKAQSVYDLGVRYFAIFLDDINNRDGANQAKVLNRFQREFIDTHAGAKPLITVPSDYCNAWISDVTYSKNLAKNLDPKINVMWTGADVIPGTMSNSDMQVPNNIYSRKMLIWWNYPVNDVYPNNIFLGPAERLDTNLSQVVSGFISNPMNQAQASRVSLFTIADFAWNTDQYDAETSWNASLKEFTGDGADALKILAENSYASNINGKRESSSITPLADKILENINTSVDVSSEAAQLKAAFKTMEAAPAIIKEKVNNPAFLNEARGYMDKLELCGKAGQIAVDMVMALRDGKMEQHWNDKQEVLKLLEQINNNSKQVGKQVIIPFIQSAVAKTDRIIKQMVSPTLTGVQDAAYITSFTESLESHPPSYMVDEDPESYYWASRSTKVGDYVGLDLQKVTTIRNVHISMGKDDSPADIIKYGKLEYSLDGQKWTAASDEMQGSDIFKHGLNIQARYIRYIATKIDADHWLVVKDFKVNMEIPEKSISDIEILNDIPVSKSIKNKLPALSWTAATHHVALKKNSYFGIRLDDIKTVKSVNIAVDSEYNAVNGVVEYSMNNRDWQTLSKIQNKKAVSLQTSIHAKFIRFRSAEENNDVVVTKFSVALEDQPVTKRVATNLSIYQDYVPSNVNDGNGNTFLWGSYDGNKSGAYVNLDLGSITNIHSIKLIMGVNGHGLDYIQQGQMQYSVDGKTWNSIGSKQASPVIQMSNLDVNARYLRYISTKEQNNWVTVGQFDVNTTMASSNLTIYQNNIPENLVDDDTNSVLWGSFNKDSKGAYISLDLGSEKILQDIKLVMDQNDHIMNGQMESSLNGRDWVAVGGPDTAATVEKTGLNLKARYVRYISTAPQSQWIKVYSFDVKPVDSFYKIYGKPQGENLYPLSNMADGMLQTAYKAESVPAGGDEITYLLSNEERATRVHVFQGKDNISNAVIQAKTSAGEWLNLGVLDKSYNAFDVPQDKDISELVITWNALAAKTPVIYEIMLQNSDKTALE